MTQESLLLEVAVQKTSNRFKSLTEALVSDYEAARGVKYLHRGAADSKALKRMMDVATDNEIRERWARALREVGRNWFSCSTIAQLGAKWNDLAIPVAPERRATANDVDLGRARYIGERIPA